MVSKNDQIQEIFREIDTWEYAPINRLLGNQTLDANNLTKRIRLFGATQHGKTTAMLSLLGIKPDMQKHLGDILRGGTEEGSSSTAVPTIYMCWDKDRFGYGLGKTDDIDESKIEICGEKELEAKIQSMNEKIRSNSSPDRNDSESDFTVYIYIPETYFEESARRDLQLVDSRGFGENANGEEDVKEINAQIVKQMVFTAGIIVVVSTDKIQSLSSDYKEILDQNNHNPDQVLILLTFAVSKAMQDAGPILERTDITPEEKAEALISYYRQEKVDNNTDEKFKKVVGRFRDRVFPVEKRSWLKENNFPGEIADCLYRQIAEKIGSMRCTTRQAAVQSVLDKTIRSKEKHKSDAEKEQKLLEDDNKKRKALIEKWKDRDKKLDGEISQIEKEQKLLERSNIAQTESIKKWQARIEKLDGEISQIEKERVEQLRILVDADRCCRSIEDARKKQTASSNICFDSIKHKGKKADKEDPDDKSRFIEIVACAVLKNFDGLHESDKAYVRKSVYDYLDQHVREYDLNYYVFKKSWEKKVRREAVRAESACLESVTETFQKELNARRASVRNENDRTCSKLKKEQCELNSLCIGNQKKIESQEKQISKLEQDVKKTKCELDIWKPKLNKIQAIYMEEFQKEKKRLSDKILQESDPELQIAWMITLAAISKSMRPATDNTVQNGGQEK